MKQKRTTKMGIEEEEEEEVDRREAAIASTPSLQPNFKPVGVTHDQLTKFQELHRRRLQIKSRSKPQKKLKDKTGKSHGKDPNAKDCTDENPSKMIEDSSFPISKCDNNKDKLSPQQDNGASHLASTKRQKLYWGLDTKERWERKANM
ncbi:hypothetical protein L1049_003124 [Liquidambar formosana]|uniref:Uncharacterized protein n=1 Tax=Liquidambar formosana TaxID=63359 RepID=A0AAP0NG75_LIQFO